MSLPNCARWLAEQSVFTLWYCRVHWTAALLTTSSSAGAMATQNVRDGGNDWTTGLYACLGDDRYHEAAALCLREKSKRELAPAIEELLGNLLAYLSSSPYLGLGVNAASGPGTIKKAYRKSALQFHPDKNPTTTELFQVIQNANEVLSSPSQKQAWDATRAPFQPANTQSTANQPQTPQQKGRPQPDPMGFEDSPDDGEVRGQKAAADKAAKEAEEKAVKEAKERQRQRQAEVDQRERQQRKRREHEEAEEKAAKEAEAKAVQERAAKEAAEKAAKEAEELATKEAEEKAAAEKAAKEAEEQELEQATAQAEKQKAAAAAAKEQMRDTKATAAAALHATNAAKKAKPHRTQPKAKAEAAGAGGGGGAGAGAGAGAGVGGTGTSGREEGDSAAGQQYRPVERGDEDSRAYLRIVAGGNGKDTLQSLAARDARFTAEQLLGWNREVHLGLTLTARLQPHTQLLTDIVVGEQVPSGQGAESSGGSEGGGDESHSDDDTECRVCHRLDSANGNRIMLCDGCDAGECQKCAGVSQVPDGDWFCSECTTKARARDAQKQRQHRAEQAKAAVTEEAGAADKTTHQAEALWQLLQLYAQRQR